MRIGGLVLIGCLLLAACTTQQQQTPSPEPTFTLVPATITPTASPTLAMQPSASPFNPGDLPTYTPVDQTRLPAEVLDIIEAILEDRRDSQGQSSEELQVISLKKGQFDDCAPGAIYRVVVGNRDTAYVYAGDAQAAITLCNDEPVLDNDSEPLPFDPIGESLVEMAINSLANQLDVEATSIEWLDLVAVTWRDSSVGCPQADGNYNPVFIDGYRIVLGADNTRYIYHSDGLEVRPCPAEREALPPPLAEIETAAQPEATATEE